MRKKSAGLLSLVVAAGLGTTLGAPAVSAAPAPTLQDSAATAGTPDEAAGHELPNPAEEKRRALRDEAITKLLHGTGTVEQRGASTVMKVGATKTAAAVGPNGKVSSGSKDPQYVELAREAGIEPGPELGRVLEELQEAVYAGEIESREEAVALARQLRQNHVQ